MKNHRGVLSDSRYGSGGTVVAIRRIKALISPCMLLSVVRFHNGHYANKAF